ncbi:hypothetical protein [Falsiroseomonas sp. HW251]|uniref:hypothetical protein n=1 Tax=Falsiroseomonas sp. HW251 TaxID=3390998 RepID=UPI003D31AA53
MRIQHPACHAVLPFTTRADVVSTENELQDRLADATPGTSIVYHVGMLARDRDRLATNLAPEQRDALNALAARAWRLAAAGWADLLQRRVGEACFAYLLVVRRRPLSARSARALAAPSLLLAEAA